MNAVALQHQSHPAAHWLTASLAGLLVLGIGYGAARYFGDERRFPVSKVEVAGDLQYVNRTQIQQLIADFASDGFYRLNIDAMQAELETRPWVAKATIRRLWPERISVSVLEREPQARWGESGLIGRDAQVFEPHQLSADSENLEGWREHFAHLPLVQGEAGRHATLLGRLHAYQSRLVLVGAEIVSLYEDERRALKLVLASGVEVQLGRRDLDQRIARLARIYEQFVAGDGEVRSVDLRYTNGFAISRGASGRTASATVPTGAE